MSLRFVITTYGNREEAERLAKEFIDRKLVACVSLIPIKSFYIWKEKTEEAEEVLALHKTTTLNSKKLMKEIEAKHSYEVPEIVELRVNRVNRAYLKWLKESIYRKAQKG
ncbi:MAG: divalent-cation tolerance protein CutA [Nitrososphaerales archaeon]